MLPLARSCLHFELGAILLRKNSRRVRQLAQHLISLGVACASMRIEDAVNIPKRNERNGGKLLLPESNP